MNFLATGLHSGFEAAGCIHVYPGWGGDVASRGVLVVPCPPVSGCVGHWGLGRVLLEGREGAALAFINCRCSSRLVDDRSFIRKHLEGSECATLALRRLARRFGEAGGGVWASALDDSLPDDVVGDGLEKEVAHGDGSSFRRVRSLQRCALDYFWGCDINYYLIRIKIS